MKTKIVLLAITSMMVLGACGGPAEWKEFASDTGAFSVLMPGTPEEQTQSVPTAAGTIDVVIYLLDLGDTAYFVGYSDFPADLVAQLDPQGLLDGAMQGAVGNVNGTVLSAQDITLDGNPGKAFTAEAQVEQPGDASVKGQIFLVENRLYQIYAMGRTGKLADADIDKFLKSFKLK